MPEPISVATGLVAGGYALVHLAAKSNTAISPESRDIQRSATALVESVERSFALFGEKNHALSTLFALLHECAEPGWDGANGKPLNPYSVSLAADFVRLLPETIPLPEFAADPDGAVSLDWIISPVRMFSISFGQSRRLAYAWLDGTDKGHAVATFDSEVIPPRILTGVQSIVGNGNSAIRAA